jgi:hypothetical protein
MVFMLMNWCQKWQRNLSKFYRKNQKGNLFYNEFPFFYALP